MNTPPPSSKRTTLRCFQAVDSIIELQQLAFEKGITFKRNIFSSEAWVVLPPWGESVTVDSLQALARYIREAPLY